MTGMKRNHIFAYFMRRDLFIGCMASMEDYAKLHSIVPLTRCFSCLCQGFA